MKKIILIIILAISFSLRFYKLGEIPIGFVSDEAAIGYNAYSILKTGRDEFGRFMPLIFQSFGDNKPPLYIYADTIAVKLFGLTKYAVRFPSALFGFLTVVIFYLIVRRISKNEKLALIAAGMLAISPWHLLFSRAAFEANLGLFLISLAILFYLIYLDNNKFFWLALFFIVNLLSLWAYHSNRVFVPICSTLIILSGILGSRNIRNNIISLVLLSTIIIIPTGLIFSSKGNLTRANQISIFSERGIQLILDEKIREDGGTSRFPLLFTRAFHNKITAYSVSLLERYFSHFNLNYLFFSGDDITRYRTKGIGLFYWWQLPFFLIGFYFVVISLLKKDSKILIIKYIPLILIWLLSGPVPASLTIETPNALRSLNSLPIYVLIIAVGLYVTGVTVSKNRFLFKLFVSTLFFSSVYCFGYYLDLYYIHDVKHQPFFYQSEYQELIPKIVKYQKTYKKIYFTEVHADPYIHYLFFSRYEPSLYQKKKKNIRSISPEGFIRYNGFDNLIFSDSPCPLKSETNTLFVCDGRITMPSSSKIIDTVYFPNGSPAFYLLEYNFLTQ